MAQPNTAQAAQPADARKKLMKDAYAWLRFAASDWNFADAEDIAQEALTRALEAWDTIGDWSIERQRAWLKQVALRTLIDEKRREGTAERNQARACEKSRSDATCQPYELLAGEEAEASRERLLGRLSDEERALFHVYAQQNAGELSCVDAAQLLNMTPAEYRAAKRRLERTVRRHARDLNLVLSDVTDDPATITDDTILLEGSDNHEED